ncbi:hypothetical protein [Arenibacter sp. F20364]|uniref:hypothetical protein n=1 Tax=Arenibacter sp. F20364 TaxID=2926415 RepID=UPI001FF51EA8|nr:hypothetical protein [Arenibacter sp. F20364]MCK0189492.1 hypothetical protein [Arenibacter sp. F20364]
MKKAINDMAPLKFEEHIKEKLDKREIVPSDRAWDLLSNQLEPKKGNVKIGNLQVGVAASIIGLLIMSLIYFNVNDELNTPDVKTVTAPDSGVNHMPENLPNENSVEGHKVDAATSKAIEIVGTETNKTPKELIEDTSSAAIIKEEEIGNVIASGEYIEPKLVEKELIGPDSLINAKIEEVVAQVNLLEQNNISLTDAEVDLLLKQAQKELFSKRIFRDNHSVDAMALLADVESELDRTFREQIFDILKEGYIKVKTAVASRNN